MSKVKEYNAFRDRALCGYAWNSNSGQPHRNQQCATVTAAEREEKEKDKTPPGGPLGEHVDDVAEGHEGQVDVGSLLQRGTRGTGLGSSLRPRQVDCSNDVW